jgi:mono/diheme cytochrome c family protein
MTAKKSKFFLALFLTTASVSAAVALMGQRDSVVLIESRESKTASGHPVYNKISYVSGEYEDVWTMRQSHQGLSMPADKWDEIRITVDKSQRPYLARFQQIQDGQEVEFKASCFTCHANGPRSIRPNYDSKDVNVDLIDRAKVVLMNLRMKAYGRVEVALENYKLRGEFREQPFKFFGKADMAPVQIKTCTLCHNSNGVLGRSVLQRQHAGTIRHLVGTGQMPPWPFTLSEAEKKELEDFLSSADFH